MNTGTGNNIADDDFLKVLLALKDNVMRYCNVAEVCEVTSIVNDVYGCKIITTGQDIACYATTDKRVKVGDIVLVTFTNTDFRSLLKRIENNQSKQYVEEDKVLHTKDNGVITGIIDLDKGEELE